MGLESPGRDEESLSYACPVTGATLAVPCPVGTCSYHLRQYKRLGFAVQSETNCLSVDMQETMEDSLSYAVRESGRVGYRDLEYYALFFKTTPDMLREIYELAVVQSRRIMLLHYYQSHLPQDYCSKCGQKNSKCKDNCASVAAYLASLIQDIQPIVLKLMDTGTVNACIWMDFRTKRALFEESVYETLEEMTHV